MLLQDIVEQHIYDNQESNFRYHLGASVLGTDCERQLWYGYRWFKEIQHDPQLLRLFARGHREEDIVLEHLKNIGIKVHAINPENGEQYRLKALGGHLGGGVDAILSDVPTMETPGLFECKTSNEKNFKKLVKDGVRQNKVEHYVQMQIYMKAFKLGWALYIAVNKNTDEWHWEIIEYDALFADNYLQRGANIIASDRPPLRLSNNPGFYQCKWCDYREICHYEETPAVNCRTCTHSSPQSDGRWHCAILPTYNIRTNEEADKQGKSINHMPCKGLRYEVIK